MGEYNLIDEKWIPTVNGLKSLKDIFSDDKIPSLSGNPIQKISILKLLLAIAQSAYTPADDYDWQDLGSNGLSKKCLEYLDKWYHKFYLFGEEPFLQMQAINKAENKEVNNLDTEIASGNTSILFSSQLSKGYSFADIALLLINQIGYGFGGKKIDKSIILTKNNYEKRTGKPGIFIGPYGYLHTFICSNSVIDTIYLNIFCQDKIDDLLFFTNGLGTPPWEKMPETEDCEIANNIKTTFIGRLVPLCRFCLITKNNNRIYIKITDGIYHPSLNDGAIDTSVTTYKDKKNDIKVIYANIDKKPWRNLTAFLSFLDGQDNTHTCLQITNSLKRARKNYKNFLIWSGGVQVSSNSGEQYVSGNDNYIESIVELSNIDLGKNWYQIFKLEMNELESSVAFVLKKSISNYFKDLKEEKDTSDYLTQFWELCEKNLNELLIACNSGNTKDIRKKFINIAYGIYDLACPKNSARQITLWAKNRPSFYKYIKGEQHGK